MTSTSNQSTNSPVARDASPLPATLSIFSRTRRYSASGLAGSRLIQLRQEESAESALQISQSCESLLLDDMDSWSIKSDSELSNSLTNTLNVNLPSTDGIGSSSPSPTSTSNRNADANCVYQGSGPITC